MYHHVHVHTLFTCTHSDPDQLKNQPNANLTVFNEVAVKYCYVSIDLKLKYTSPFTLFGEEYLTRLLNKKYVFNYY